MIATSHIKKQLPEILYMNQEAALFVKKVVLSSLSHFHFMSWNISEVYVFIEEKLKT